MIMRWSGHCGTGESDCAAMSSGGAGGPVGVIGIGEPRQGRGVDREGVEPIPGVAALLEDRLGDVLVGPLPVELAATPGLHPDHQQGDRDESGGAVDVFRDGCDVAAFVFMTI